MRADTGALAVEVLIAAALAYLIVTVGGPWLQRHRERQARLDALLEHLPALERATQALLVTAQALRHLDRATVERVRELLAEIEAEERERRRRRGDR